MYVYIIYIKTRVYIYSHTIAVLHVYLKLLHFIKLLIEGPHGRHKANRIE